MLFMPVPTGHNTAVALQGTAFFISLEPLKLYDATLKRYVAYLTLEVANNCLLLGLCSTDNSPSLTFKQTRSYLKLKKCINNIL